MRAAQATLPPTSLEVGALDLFFDEDVDDARSSTPRTTRAILSP